MLKQEGGKQNYAYEEALQYKPSEVLQDGVCYRLIN